MFIGNFHMFMVVLLIITKNWSQPRYPPVGEWINKLWCIYTMKFYSMIKE